MKGNQTYKQHSLFWPAVLMNAIIIKAGYIYHSDWYWGLLVSVPMLMLAFLIRWLAD